MIRHELPGSAEAAVRGVLADGRWRTSAEIGDETGLLGPAVSLTVRDLASRGCVSRSIGGGWQITATAAPDVADHGDGGRR